MTDFWQGQRPWSAFEQMPGWDGAGNDVADHTATTAPPARADRREVPLEVEFVQHAIQQSYDR